MTDRARSLPRQPRLERGLTAFTAKKGESSLDLAAEGVGARAATSSSPTRRQRPAKKHISGEQDDDNTRCTRPSLHATATLLCAIVRRADDGSITSSLGAANRATFSPEGGISLRDRGNRCRTSAIDAVAGRQRRTGRPWAGRYAGVACSCASHRRPPGRCCARGLSAASPRSRCPLRPGGAVGCACAERRKPDAHRSRARSWWLSPVPTPRARPKMGAAGVGDVGHHRISPAAAARPIARRGGGGERSVHHYRR